MLRMIMINSKAQLIVDIIIKVAENKITVENASKLLNKSRRTIERYLQRYHDKGFQFVIHGNTGNEPANKLPNNLKKQVQTLIKEKYYDLNLLHLQEKLEINENITVKRETLRSWAHEIHHVKRAKRRRSRVHKHRERMELPGLMLQMDGCTHQWFGNNKSCLIAAIDDANSELYAEFFTSETSTGCLKVIRSIIEKKGVFKTLYVDRAGIFGGPKRCHFSQVQRACEELGIEIIFANSPQGKGRIERAFNTLQDRLIPEFRLHEITNMADANNYLNQEFIPKYWRKKITVQAKALKTAFTPLLSHIKLDDICVMKEYRKIRNDHTFSYGNKFYFIDSPIKHSIAQQKIEIIKDTIGGFNAYFAGRKLDVSEVVEPSKATVEDIEIQKKLDVLALANKLGNVAKAARLSGVSRDTIYRHRRLIKEGGIEALRRQETLNLYHKNRAPKELENLVIQYSIKNPHLGQQQVAMRLKNEYNTEISPNGVRLIWLREGMNTAALRAEKVKNLTTPK